MKTTLHIVKAHISKQKSATLSLFVILMVISALITISTSVLFGVASDFKAGRDRLNSLHSAFVMSRDIYSPSFEEIIREDPRVSQYDIGEVLFPSGVTVNYGGEVELMYGSLIFSLNQPAKLSAPKITEEDPDIPREEAIYLPKYAKGFGFNLGDPFTMTYRNRQIHFTVAAFFETSELGDAGNLSLKFFVPHECYERLTQWFARSVWIAIRFYDDNDSVLFNRDFAKKIDLEHSSFAFERDSIALSTSALTPVSVFSAIVVIFALLLSFISMLVIRFRVSNSIENAMHEIGVLEASGYTSLQIIGSYLAEYGILSFLSGSLGVFLSIPVFPAIRQVLSSLTGTSWTLHSDIKAGIVSVLLITAILQMMIWRSCRKIKLLPPVAALRGGVAANGSKRNFFPLHKGGGNVHTRLGLKNMLVFSKTYALIGLVIAGISLAVVFMAITYQNFVYHHTALAKLTGHELSDVSLIVARHTDADAMAAQIEQMPQVRRTSMLDYANIDIEDLSIEGMVSSDFGRLESMSAKEGRFPKYDNEVALPKITAAKMGKGIGDSVNIKAKGVSLPYIITGFYSVASNEGRMATITLEGYQRLDPNYKRSGINIYLHEGVTFNEFSEVLTQNFGVLNVYKQDADSRFAEAKARAEEKISNYLESYHIDSIEYAVIYQGEIILSGSSATYQIEKITDFHQVLQASLGSMANTVALITQVFVVVSLLVISLILIMTVRSIVAKRRRELGILKAAGFTTKQLAWQLAISFMPLTALGTVFGCLGGVCLVNPAFDLMLANEGVQDASLVIDPLLIAVVGILTLLVTFAVANASAMGIKNISVYELLSE